jgi:hypothetical protein
MPIHRDVKPANIVLADDDFACLLDFGLANAANEAKLTSTGVTSGTFAYMAPERLSAGEVDHRTDIYALACVLYECLTGSPPYTMQDHAALIAAHPTAPIPRPSQHGPGIPTAFDDVIATGMAKNPCQALRQRRRAGPRCPARAGRRGPTQADTIAASTRAATRAGNDQPTLSAADPPKAGRAAGAKQIRCLPGLGGPHKECIRVAVARGQPQETERVAGAHGRSRFSGRTPTQSSRSRRQPTANVNRLARQPEHAS